MSEQNEVDQALTSIKEIRAIINRVQIAADPLQEKRSLGLALVLQLMALTLGLFFWIGEALTRASTLEFARSAIDQDFRTQGLISLAVILGLLVVGLYVIIRFEAKSSEDSINNYLKKNFPTILTLTFFSDLLVKYAAITAVILALKPTLIPPLLLIFLADYLIQGRFFVLPFKLSIAGAVVLILLALTQLCYGTSFLLWSFSAFCFLSFGSAIYLSYKLLRIKNK